MTPLELKENRKKLKLTQDELAKELGVDRRTIINYEKGEVIPESKVKLLHIIFEKGINALTQEDKKTEDPYVDIVINSLTKSPRFNEWIDGRVKQIQKEISTDELKAEMEKMLIKYEKEKARQKQDEN